MVNCANYAEKKNEKYYFILDEIEIKHLEIIRELFPIIKKKDLITRTVKYINNLEKFFDSIYEITYLSNISINKIMNFGELLSSYLVNEKLKESGFISTWKDSRDLIVSSDYYNQIQVNFTKSIFNIKKFLIKENTHYIILPGFISSSIVTETSTLGRGGSDYSASILSSAIPINLLEIWTDVSGVMTRHPNGLSKAFPLENISYRETIELSSFGAKIIYPPTILPSMIKSIPIIIRNTFSPLECGTLIFFPFKRKNIVTGVQNITFQQRELCLEKQILIDSPLDKELCIIAIIINDNKNIPVTLCHLFSTFGEEWININGIGYGNIKKNISTVISKKKIKII